LTIAIGEVARRTNLPRSTIRYYEAEGLLPKADRRSGWRAFAPDVVDRLQVISMARELGFSLDDIRTLLNGFSVDTPPSVRWQKLALRKLPEVDAMLLRAGAVKRLLEKGLRCDCVTVQDCIKYDCNPPVTLARRRSEPGAI
jgi:MerR family transcriptional regulator, redox-sensitive transcriptional activator SoxR